MNSNYQYIISEIKGKVGIIFLNRPEVFNSFTIPMAIELQKALDEFAQDKSIRSIVITGNGKAFCAGQDLKEAISIGAENIEEIVTKTYNPIIQKLTGIEKPIIAAVNGIAAGAGANIALACDIVFASNEAYFSQAFSSIGLIPDSGGTYILPRLIGWQRAAALMYTGEKISAENAKNMGMIWEVCKHEQLMNDVLIFAEMLANRPTKAIGLTKKLLNLSYTSTLNEQLEWEKKIQAQAGKTKDNKEGIMAFLEKRKPVFTGE